MRMLVTALTLGAMVPTLLVAGAQPLREVPLYSLEVTGDGAFPVGKLGDAELDAGFGFGANLTYRSLARDLTLAPSTRSVTVNHVTATVGLTIAF